MLSGFQKLLRPDLLLWFCADYTASFMTRFMQRLTYNNPSDQQVMLPFTTVRTHAKLVSLTSPGRSGWTAPMNTPQGQQRTAEQRWVRWLKCLIRKWSCVNHQFQFHTQIAYKPAYMTRDLCYLLLFLIIGTDIQFNHTNPAIHFSGHSHSLLTSASDYTSAQWKLVLHFLVTCSSHVNKCWIDRAIYDNTCGPSEYPLCHDGRVWQEVKSLRQCPEALRMF